MPRRGLGGRLRAVLRQTFYSVRSGQMLTEQRQYNLVFRWFVVMEMDEGVWNHAVYSKNRERSSRSLVHYTSRALESAGSKWYYLAQIMNRTRLFSLFGMLFVACTALFGRLGQNQRRSLPPAAHPIVLCSIPRPDASSLPAKCWYKASASSKPAPRYSIRPARRRWTWAM